MEIYQWLFRKNGFKVSKTGYFVYCNGNTDEEAFDAIECLKSDGLSKSGQDCDFCKHREAVRTFEK